MTITIDLLEAEIARRRAQISEHEEAIAKLDHLAQSLREAAPYLPDKTNPSPRESLARLAAHVAARAVLQASEGNPVHYKQVARLAMSRGYASNEAGAAEEKIAKRLLDAMRRLPDVFVRQGVSYRLRTESEDTESEGTELEDQPKTLADVAETILAEDEEPLHIKEIIEKAGGFFSPAIVEHKGFYNRLYSAMSRSPKFSNLGLGKWCLAEEECGIEKAAQAETTAVGHGRKGKHAGNRKRASKA